MRVLALVCVVVVSGCAPSLKMRRLARPTAALGDVRTLSLELVPDPKLDAFTNGERITDYLKTRMTYELKSRFTLCEPAPCGDGALRVSLHELSFDAPAGSNPLGGFFGAPQAGSRTVRVVFAASFAGSEPRRRTSLRTGADAPDAMMRGILNELAHDYVDAFAPRPPLSEFTLESCEGCNAGIELLHKGDFKGAAAVFQARTDAHPDDASAWANLAFALEAQGLWKSARDAYKKAGNQTAAAAIDAILPR